MPPRRDFERHMDKEPVLPVYALVGAESTLVTEAMSAVRGTVLTHAADFNRDEFRAGDTPIAHVVDAAATMPMMAAKRWVHLSDMQRLKAKDHPTLIAYLEKPSPSTVLCLSGTKIDGRTKLGQKLLSSAALFSIEPPTLREVVAWLERRAAKRGYSIDRDAAQLLADLLGTDVGSLDMALDKLATYGGDGKTICAEHIDEVVAPTRLHSIFELTDAIGRRDLTAAATKLRNAIGGGENALMVLAMIARQLRHLLHVKELCAAGAQQSDIASRVGIRPFLVQPLTDQAKRYNAAELCSALDAVARADVRLKSSRLDPGVILDRLLVEVVASVGVSS
ncbi:MAG: DNA polymerase III subunit delta [Myxococcota bacterium]